MIARPFRIAACAVLILGGGGTGLRAVRTSSPQDLLRDAIDRQIHRNPATLVGHPRRRALPARMNANIVRLYHDRDMEPYWVTADGPDRNAEILRSVLEASETQGLDPSDYAVAEIARDWVGRDVETLARLELLLTVELVAYESDLVQGRHQPRDFDPDLFPTACACDLDQASLFEMAVAAPDLKTFLESQAPPFLQYSGLREKLAEYRRIAAQGGWPAVPQGSSLKPGARDPRLAAVRKRLSVSGEWGGDGATDSPDYDEALAAAIRRFQSHQGLEPDGIIGPATRAAMNIPVERRIRQLILNMESWRWVDRDHGDWWLEVNIPSFSLLAVRHERIDLSMEVIVGDEYHMTPVFSDRVRYVEFNPRWDIPLSIARKELLPKLQEDPLYLKKEHIRVFEHGGDGGKEIDSAAVDWKTLGPDDMSRYHLQQDAGPENALGQLAFIFPNPYDVYLHDTPAAELFRQPRRAFSHGCIRVAEAPELAVYILGGPDQGWTVEKVHSLMAEGKYRAVHLKLSLPVYILYNTAVVDLQTHDLFFYDDIYGRDTILAKAIF